MLHIPRDIHFMQIQIHRRQNVTQTITKVILNRIQNTCVCRISYCA